MKLFQQFAPLVQAGVVVTLTLRAAGDKLQFEILPQANTGKTGIAIPPRALLGTPQELDAEVPGFLDDYVKSGANLNEQIAVCAAVMQEAEAKAKDAVKTAAQPKKAVPAKTSAPSQGAGPGKQRDLNSGFIDEDQDDGQDDGSPCSTDGGDDTRQCVVEAASGSPAAEPAGGENLFSL